MDFRFDDGVATTFCRPRISKTTVDHVSHDSFSHSDPTLDADDKTAPIPYNNRESGWAARLKSFSGTNFILMHAKTIREVFET